MSTMTGDETEETEESADNYSNSRVYNWLDDRLGIQDEFLGKAFPEDKYASFLLGEVSLFSFAILVLTGTFLGLLYVPAVAPVEYVGQVAKYHNKEVPAAFASVLRISYDVRFGMFVRYLHHWASYLFIAAMTLHMLRVLFSGAYRNPREINWMVGASILFISLLEGVFGYALPFDEFSSTATAITVEIAGSVPFIGHDIILLVFGGEWPTGAEAVIPRLFFLHVFLVPLLIAGLIGIHMFLLVRQKHTEQAGARDSHDPPKDDQSVVVGTPLVPNQTYVTLIVFFMTVGVLAFLAGFFPTQRIAIFGPSDPTSTPSGVGPDWFLLWTFGYLKMVPSYYFGLSELLGGVSLAEFFGGVLIPGIVGTVLALWPFIDYSSEEVHFTADPIRRPVPTAVAVAGLAHIMMASLAGMNNVIATMTGIPSGKLQLPLQLSMIVIPVVWGFLTYGLLKRRKEREDTVDHSRAAAGLTESDD